MSAHSVSGVRLHLPAGVLARGAVTLLGVAFSAAILGLVSWTLLPVAFGWAPSVVLTGSMVPEIQPGDVIVVAPIPEKGLQPGYVIRFRDPDRPERFLMHRIVKINPDGRIVTKGDANPTEDSTPVALTEVKGMARLRVPYVGLPAIWLRERHYTPIAGAFVLLVLALVVATSGGGNRRHSPRHLRR